MRLLKRKSRRPDAVEKLQLEKVIGFTSSNTNGFACNPANGDLAFLAGCVVVVFSTDTYCQTKFLMVSRAPKALTCVTYSPHGGKLIAAGESGHQPAVIIWDASDRSCLAELKAHKYGVSCVKFSPNGKHLLSIGYPHDAQICLFDYKSGSIIAKFKSPSMSSPASDIHFASDGSFFVTAGVNQLKHWTMCLNASRQKPASAGIGLYTLDGRSINTGSLRENSFVAVASDEDYIHRRGVQEIQPIYALTSSGILCLLHRGLAVKKWVNLKVRQAHALSVSASHIACACSDGIVRIFMSETLGYAATLPRPAPLGFHDLTDTKTCMYLATHNVNGITYPGAVACRFATPVKIAVIYADHSLFIWDVQCFSKIQKCHSFLSHSECIWDGINLPPQSNQGTASLSNSIRATASLGRHDGFATCSSDGSIRLWCVDCGEGNMSNVLPTSISSGNVYDRNLFGVLYQDKRGDLEEKAASMQLNDLIKSNKGFRSISVSSDGHYLAAGDRGGNLYIYDLRSSMMINFKEAHDAEILTLSFGSVVGSWVDNEAVEVTILASGGRDRLVHIYNASRDFEVIETLDDHSASVTSTKFACNSSKLLSSSADKSVVFRNIEANSIGIKSTRYHQEMASRGTVYDLDIDSSRKLAVTVGQDKKVNFLSLSTGKSVKSFKPEGDFGEPIKVKVDPSATCIVCSHSDKSLRLYDAMNGDFLASGQGHSEVITGVFFMHDCKHLVSVSGDSCIFVWKLPCSVAKLMRKRSNCQSESQNSQASLQPSETVDKEAKQSTGTLTDISYADDNDIVAPEIITITPHAGSDIPPAFKFSVSRLPPWAQAKVSQVIPDDEANDLEGFSFRSSQSRWVERLGSEGYKLFSEPEVPVPPATVLPSNFGLRRRFTIEPSASTAYSTPESSLDSQLSHTSESSPHVSGRKYNHWKTVHTLFFDEEEYLEEDALSSRNMFMPHGNDKECQNVVKLHANMEQLEADNPGKDDSTVVYFSEDDREPTISLITKLSHDPCSHEWKSPQGLTDEAHFQTAAPRTDMLNTLNQTDTDLLEAKTTFNRSCRIEKTDKVTGIQEHFKSQLERQEQGHNVVPTLDEMSDEDESDIPFCAESDLFNSHFGNLSTSIKVHCGQASARRSFSTRFFAQSSHLLPIMSLFQESPHIDGKNVAATEFISIKDDASTLLAKERECMKLREEQENTFSKVHCLPFYGTPPGISSSKVGSKDMLINGVDDLQVPGLYRAVEEQSHLHSNCKSQAELDLSLCASKSIVLANDSLTGTQSRINNVECISVPESIPCCGTLSEKEIFLQDVTDIEVTSPGQQPNTVLDEERPASTCLMGEIGDVFVDAEKGLLHCGSVELVKPEEAVAELKSALYGLTGAIDKALKTFRELELSRKTKADGSLVSTVSSLYEEFIPLTLQKVWLLSDSMTQFHGTSEGNISVLDHSVSLDRPCSSFTDHSSLRLSNTGMARQCMATSSALSGSALESIDIEGFIENYSVRFSATLASQVLALVQKGLSNQQD